MSGLLKRLAAALGASPDRGAPQSQPVELSLAGYDTVYAVGDVHGCLDLARTLEARILRDGEETGAGKSLTLYLGDVIDRGPKSAHVLDLLTARSDTMERRCLRGNHEQFMLDFLAEPRNALDWLDFGGTETLQSYGVYEGRRFFERASPAEARALLAATIPEAHRTFLGALPHFAMRGDTLFCHAGLDPTKPLGGQSAEDFMWARERFLAHREGYGVTVVHGHTPTAAPRLEWGRAGVDTGAYESGRLTCAKVSLASGEVTFMSSQ